MTPRSLHQPIRALIRKRGPFVSECAHSISENSRSRTLGEISSNFLLRLCRFCTRYSVFHIKMDRGRPPVVLVLGHSFIERLKSTVDAKRTLANLGLRPGFARVKMAGFPGLTMLEGRAQFDRAIARYRPRVVMLQIGGNDINGKHGDRRPESIGSDVHDYAQSIRAQFPYVQRVVVFSVLSRFGKRKRVKVGKGKRRHTKVVNSEFLKYGMHQKVFEKHKKVLNNYMEVVLGAESENGIHFWQLDSLDRPDVENVSRGFIGDDGVHLNDRGTSRYFREIRGAVITYANA